MKTAIGNFKASMLRQAGMAIQLEEEQFQFIKSRKGILDALNLSKKNKGLISICSPALGSGMCLTAIEDICNSEQIVVLNRYDVSGQLLPKTRLSVSEIRCVCTIQADPSYPHQLHPIVSKSKRWLDSLMQMVREH